MSNYRELINKVLSNKKSIVNNTDYALSLYQKWYAGYDPKFHKYYVYNGTEYVPKVKASLKMAKKICEDWASLLWSEKLKVVVGSEENNERINKLLKDKQFWVKGNQAVEIGFALGYSALAVDIVNLQYDPSINDSPVIISDKTDIKLSCYNARYIVPINFVGGEITECAFMQTISNDIRINAHILDENGDYHIICYHQDKEGREDTVDINTHSKKPLFAIIHPNIVNNLRLDSPYPISIFANSIDQLKAIDNKYDAFDNEYIMGKKRVYVSSKMNKMVYQKNEKGEEVALEKRTFDGSDVVIYQLPEAEDGKPYVYSPNDPLRTADLVSAIQSELKILGTSVGLGNGYYSYERSTAVTATQVISEKSDTYANIKKHEQVLENAIRSIVEALIYANNTFTNNEKIQSEDISILFDDSIIEDKETEKTNDRKDVEAGVMSNVQFRMKWYGEDEDTAKELCEKYDVAKIGEKLMPFVRDGTMPLKMFCSIVYGEEFVKKSGYSSIDELVAEMEEKKKSENISYEDVIGGYLPPKDAEEDENPTPSEEEGEKE